MTRFTLLVGDEQSTSAVLIPHTDMLSVRKTYRRLISVYPDNETTARLSVEVVKTAECFMKLGPEKVYLQPWYFTAFVMGTTVTLKQHVPHASLLKV